MVTFDTPAHVHYAPKIENGVRVQGGTNYDISRGGVSTPVVKIPDPVPVLPAAIIEYVPPADLARTSYEAKHKVPDAEPVLVLNFSRNSSVLSAESRAAVASLKKGVRYVVVGHADAGEDNAGVAAKARAKAVATSIKGSRVERAVSFADTLPLTSDTLNAEKNRRVEIFEAPKKQR